MTHGVTEGDWITLINLKKVYSQECNYERAHQVVSETKNAEGRVREKIQEQSWL